MVACKENKVERVKEVKTDQEGGKGTNDLRGPRGVCSAESQGGGPVGHIPGEVRSPAAHP